MVVPMLNPDGCYLGNYRTDSTGVDLNRMWGCANEALEPSLYHVKELARRLRGSMKVSVTDARGARGATAAPFALLQRPDCVTFVVIYVLM